MKIRKAQPGPENGFGKAGDPNGIRTRVTTLKGSLDPQKSADFPENSRTTEPQISAILGDGFGKTFATRSAARLSCIIEGCRRSTKRLARFRDDTEWLCQRHWRSVDKALRERHLRFRRIERKYVRRRRSIPTLVQARFTAAWSICVEDARIKAAMGVA